MQQPNRQVIYSGHQRAALGLTHVPQITGESTMEGDRPGILPEADGVAGALLSSSEGPSA
jgi:hypothetical protein